MAGNYENCDVNKLLTDSACISLRCSSGWMHDAIDVGVRVANLAAVGGPDYQNDLTGLLTASKDWQVLSSGLRKQVDLWLDIQNAIANGALHDFNLQDFLAKVECYQCLGFETRKNVRLWLKCQINRRTWPD